LAETGLSAFGEQSAKADAEQAGASAASDMSPDEMAFPLDGTTWNYALT
jgi:hypothetical protein